jgi:hypothetical protein
MPIFRERSPSGTIRVTHNHQMFSRRLPLCALIISGVIALGLTARAFAQEKPKPQTQSGDSSAGQTPNAPSGSSPATLYNSLQKKSLFFPDIVTNTGPLSPGGKFKLFVDNSISLSTIGFSAVSAAVSQADDSPTGYGQGWDAYGKRFGSSMGRQASSEFFGTFMLASALHEDPRFYPNVNPSLGRAITYSMQRVFVTRNDDGRDVANWSGLAGPLMAEGLANVYWPDRNRTVGDTFLRYGLDLATRAGGNLLREYWPVVYGKIHHAPQPAGGHN